MTQLAYEMPASGDATASSTDPFAKLINIFGARHGPCHNNKGTK